MEAESPKSALTMPKSLPPGWKREVVVRKNGLSAGKSDVYYYRCVCVCVCLSTSHLTYNTWLFSPPPKYYHFYFTHCSPCGKKFRSKPQIAKFLGDNHNLDLSCFDFSRGAYGEVTQRRRARDRQIGKKMEPVKPIPVVKPLTVNPLRASGPIRRTCGVIKLPVTWVAPPDDDQGRTNLNAFPPGEPKSQIHLIVQSLWEKRLFGVKPYDHVTGDEILGDSSNDKVEIKPITPISKPNSPRTSSPIPCQSHSPTSMKSTPCVTSSAVRQQQSSATPSLLPSLLQVHQALSPAKARDQQNSDVTPSISVIQQTGQPIIVPQQVTTTAQSQSHQRLTPSTSLHHRYSPTQFSNGLSSSTKPPVAPVAPMVTDRELQIQEERVRLLRQQLLAASTSRPSST